MDRNGASLYLSAITVAEVDNGIARSCRTGAQANFRRSADWLATVLHLYGSRILPIAVSTARRIGVLADDARRQEHDSRLADLAIAATAAVKGHVILTRNLRHFVPMRIPAQSIRHASARYRAVTARDGCGGWRIVPRGWFGRAVTRTSACTVRRRPSRDRPYDLPPSTPCDWIAKGLFPKPVRLGARFVGWSVEELGA